MKCPACQKEMTEQDFGSDRVDVCEQGCRGIWFDWRELMEVDESGEGHGPQLEQAAAEAQGDRTRSEPLTCPHCNTPMHAHRHKPLKSLVVDECYSCGGYFLDPGELGALRAMEACKAGVALDFTVEQAAARLATSDAQILRWTKSHRLPSKEIDGQLFVDRYAVLELQAERRTSAED